MDVSFVLEEVDMAPGSRRSVVRWKAFAAMVLRAGDFPPRRKAIWICSSMDASSVGLNSTCDMHQGYGRFKATANKLPVSMDKNRLSMSVFHGYNSIGMKRAFQALPTVNSERPNLRAASIFSHHY